MILYHGSKDIIEKPIYGQGKKYNDYGLGFYCTDNIELAKEWGTSFERSGYANRYQIDCTELKILDLNDDKYCILHWLAILLSNREFDTPAGLALEAKEFLIKGYRADDSYFSFAQDFINGTISYRQLNNAMYLGKLGIQYVLKSKEAFNRIVFDGYEEAEYKEWYAKKMKRDKSARREYFDVERNRRQRGDIYITQILDEEMSPDDKRLR